MELHEETEAAGNGKSLLPLKHKKSSSNFGVETTKMSYFSLFCGFPELISGAGTGWIPRILDHI